MGVGVAVRTDVDADATVELGLLEGTHLGSGATDVVLERLVNGTALLDETFVGVTALDDVLDIR